MIDSCLRLHGQLSPPQMMTFHGTLESFFRKNFQEEIQRLSVEVPPSEVVEIRHQQSASVSSPYQQSLNEAPSSGSVKDSGSATRGQYTGGALDLARTPLDPPPLSSHPNGPITGEHPHSAKQTPLQRHLAHLARHGFNGVASGPRDHTSDSISEGSPHDSYMNGGGMPLNMQSSASVAGSTLGSIGSLRGRISRFGSLNFGRRDG